MRNRTILVAIVVALVLPTAAQAAVVPAVTAALLSETSAPVQDAAIFCGPLGCGPVWPGPHSRKKDWGPWGHVYRPACPTNYYYACRRGPLGYGQCACWPYRRW